VDNVGMVFGKYEKSIAIHRRQFLPLSCNWETAAIWGCAIFDLLIHTHNFN
jgi:hypothetical protein